MPPFDLTRYHDVLSTRSFGRNLIFEASVGSTMDLARDAAQHGAAEGTLALADEQTAGRGRLGRSWVTPPALNLASTLVLRPPREVLRQIAMIPPLAVVGAVAETCGVSARIKWPNDVLVQGTGDGRYRKLAGILIESEIKDNAVGFVLVGTGINVNFDPREHDEIRDIATSLRVELGREVERETVLAAYLAHFESLYDDAKAGRSPLPHWRALLVTLGQHVRATTPGRTVDGVAEDVDEDGALLLRTAEGSLVVVEAGDVTLRE